MSNKEGKRERVRERKVIMEARRERETVKARENSLDNSVHDERTKLSAQKREKRERWWWQLSTEGLRDCQLLFLIGRSASSRKLF